jgi:alpha-glucosidase
MRKGSEPLFEPLSKLAVSQISSQAIRLQSRREVVAVCVLAPDLFRLRMARGKHFSQQRSWAVEKTEWDGVATNICRESHEITLATSAGKLLLRVKDGSWRLLDRSGNEVFSTIPGATGFVGAQGRVTLTLAESESLHGLGETTGPFNKRGLRRVFWNIDVLGHAPAIHPGLQSLYLSIPFTISLREGRAAGLFWDNPARQTWDMGQTKLEQWQMQADLGEIDLYLFLGPNVCDVISRFTELTGRMPLPPRWALGYHQCRYSYESAARVEALARTFRRKRIPCDAIYLDIHHMDAYRVFTFGKSFPKPRQLLARLAKNGFKIVTIVDPGVKEERRFGVFTRGKRQRGFVKEANGTKDYVGKVWPGEVRFPDFTNLRTRTWWGQEQARLQELGAAGFWNDMNEPANFAIATKTLPEDCVHHSDVGPLTHAAAHNIYGMQMARASRDGALAHQPDSRPFIITRAGYAGVQRYALAWTGDNSSVWEHLGDSIQMLLNLGLSGVGFCGADVGGFLDNATGELLARWTQMAAFTPFFRNHSNIGTHDQEPWAFGPEVEAVCKAYIELRYQLLPYLYLLFVEAHRFGAPIMRPLLWHYENDPTAVGTDDQFLLGADLLVAPILRQSAVARSVYLPPGEWFNFWTGQRHSGHQYVLAKAGLESIPVYTRAGSLIPMAAVQQYVGKQNPATINLHVWPGAPGQLRWYEDDGSSLAHTRGESHERTIEFSTTRRGHRLYFSAARGRFKSEVKLWRMILRAAERPLRASVNGRPLRGRFDRSLGLFACEFTNAPSAIEVVMQ